MCRHLRILIAALALTLVGASAGQGQERFSHEAHDGLFPLCTGCHGVEADGSVSYPDQESCASCHDGEQEPPVEWAAQAPFAGFDHRFHEGTSADRPGCSDCHGGGEAWAVSVVRSGCAECHVQHHAGEVRCRACHGESPQAGHTVVAHAGCAGAGCHDADAVSGILFERELCLLCHAPMLDHKPGQRCGRCHAVGQPGG
jgi:hypothetical protein